MRVLTPNYVRWVDGSDTFTTNYTIPNTNETITVEFNDTGSNELIFNFPRGITFPDIISLEFSMTADPDALRRPGAGDEQSAAVIHPTCVQHIIDGYPDGSQEQFCGEFDSMPLQTSAPGTN